MNTVDSLLSSITLSSENTSTTSTVDKPTLIIKEEYCDDTMPVLYKVVSLNETQTDSNVPKSTEQKIRVPSGYTIVSYGPINVRVKLHEAPTLKTGRRSRFLPLEGDAAKKREIQREKNRKLAKRLKEQRDNIERQLVIEINELETREKDLIDQVRNLESYKEFLHNRYEEKIQNQITKIEQD